MPSICRALRPMPFWTNCIYCPNGTAAALVRKCWNPYGRLACQRGHAGVTLGSTGTIPAPFRHIDGSGSASSARSVPISVVGFVMDDIRFVRDCATKMVNGERYDVMNENNIAVFPDGVRQVTCRDCIDGAFDLPISMAFQPIVDTQNHRVFAYEALVRGPDGASAGSVLEQVNRDNRYFFDQAARVTAIRLAAGLGLMASDAQTMLSINFMPNAVYRAQTCIRATLEAARHYDFDPERLIFEVAEGEKIVDRRHLMQIIDVYRQEGFTIALDDFGEGYAGLNHLVEIRPDLIKLDLSLIRDIDTDTGRQAVVRATSGMCRDLGIDIVAEGVETRGEWQCLEDLGISLIQGYFFARPGFETLPKPLYHEHD